MKHQPLPYPASALSPVLNELTVVLHHGQYHAGCVRGVQKARKRIEAAQSQRVEGNTKVLPHLLKSQYRRLAFNRAGALLHDLYWNSLTGPGLGGDPSGRLLTQIEQDFGTSTVFLHELVDVGGAIEGQGWVVLAWLPHLEHLTLLPIKQHQDGWIPGAVPLLAIDLWEHAYYTQYEGSKTDYLKAVLSIVDWAAVSRRFEEFGG